MDVTPLVYAFAVVMFVVVSWLLGTVRILKRDLDNLRHDVGLITNGLANEMRRISCEPLRYQPYEPDWRRW